MDGPPGRKPFVFSPAAEPRAGGRCLFCDITSGRAAAHRVYEDARVVAFLDRFPVAVGHTLVCPRVHVEKVGELGEEDLVALFRVVQRVARAVEAALEPDGLNLLVNQGAAAGQVVFHVHVHVSPRWRGQGFTGRRLSEAEARFEETAERLRGAIR
ncbi:MAG: HIT domain-containing protein [Euryarchaeota archaeon]|nr:HIT domain-containing protein [Euryarchaeota archaeon]